MLYFIDENLEKFEFEKILLSKEQSMALKRMNSLSYLARSEVEKFIELTPPYLLEKQSIQALEEEGCYLSENEIQFFHPKNQLLIEAKEEQVNLPVLKERWAKIGIDLVGIHLPCRRKSTFGQLAKLQTEQFKDPWKQLDILSHLFFQDCLKVYGLTR
ncbi:MAG: hypothetical protein M9962_11570 [Oligoflexia bacterium]|nr:hypothetical protein [Oligoflexia bacterium]